MAEQILVPLNRNDRIEEIIPYLEKIARPGMRIVFLIPYPVNGFAESFRDHWVTTESLINSTLVTRQIEQKYSWENQKRLAELKVFLAREVLHKQGVEVTADVYLDRLRRALASYTRSGDVHLIMMRAGRGLSTRRLLGRTNPLFRLFKPPGHSPVLVLYPSQEV